MHIILLLLLRCRLQSNEIDERKLKFREMCAARVLVVSHHTHRQPSELKTDVLNQLHISSTFWHSPGANQLRAVLFNSTFVQFLWRENNGTSEWCRQAYACWLRIAIVYFLSLVSFWQLTMHRMSPFRSMSTTTSMWPTTSSSLLHFMWHLHSRSVCIQGIHSVRLHFDTFFPIHYCATSERDQHNREKSKRKKRRNYWKMYVFNDKRRTTNSMAIVSARTYSHTSDFYIYFNSQRSRNETSEYVCYRLWLRFFFSHTDVSKQEEK